MTAPIAGDVARVADSAAPREQRAREAAELIRAAGDFGGVAIYDVGDDGTTIVGASGWELHGSSAALSDATVVEGRTVVVPVLGPESGIVMGALAAEGGTESPSAGDVALLEACAATLRPLYD